MERFVSVRSDRNIWALHFDRSDPVPKFVVHFRSTTRLACVASVSVGIESKERRGTGFWCCQCPRGKWGESQKWKTRSIFRAVILCSRAQQKRLPRRQQTDSLSCFSSVDFTGKKMPRANPLVWPSLIGNCSWSMTRRFGTLDCTLVHTLRDSRSIRNDTTLCLGHSITFYMEIMLLFYQETAIRPT